MATLALTLTSALSLTLTQVLVGTSFRLALHDARRRFRAVSGSELLRGGVELFHHPSLRAHRQPSGGADGPNPSLELQKRPVGGEPSEAPRAKASPASNPNPCYP